MSAMRTRSCGLHFRLYAYSLEQEVSMRRLDTNGDRALFPAICEHSSSSPRRKSIPSVEAIHEYWRVDGAEVGIANQVEETPCCYACGSRSAVPERCHIVSRAAGGSNDLENLVLLCSRCHGEHPDLECPEAMLDWIANHEAESEIFYKNLMQPLLASPEWARFSRLGASQQERVSEAIEASLKAAWESARSHRHGFAWATYLYAARRAMHAALKAVDE